MREIDGIFILFAFLVFFGDVADCDHQAGLSRDRFSFAERFAEPGAELQDRICR